MSVFGFGVWAWFSYHLGEFSHIYDLEAHLGTSQTDSGSQRGLLHNTRKIQEKEKANDFALGWWSGVRVLYNTVFVFFSAAYIAVSFRSNKRAHPERGSGCRGGARRHVSTNKT
jgi:hypothetical protein